MAGKKRRVKSAAATAVESDSDAIEETHSKDSWKEKASRTLTKNAEKLATESWCPGLTMF